MANRLDPSSATLSPSTSPGLWKSVNTNDIQTSTPCLLAKSLALSLKPLHSFLVQANRLGKALTFKMLAFHRHSHAAPRALLSFARHSSTMTGENCVKRLTMFKIPREEDIEKVLKEYEVLRKNAKKNGKPYIISNTARKVLNTSSPLSEGFTLASQSIFRNHADHDFYDKECPAHKKLKETTGKVRTGIMTLVTEGQWPEPKL